MKSTNKVCTLH